MGVLTLRFPDPVPALIFGAYSVALVLLLATDLDQRLLPNELTLPAIPIVLRDRHRRASTRSSRSPTCRSRSSVAIVIPGILFLVSIPFGAGAIGLGDLKLLVSVGLLAGAYRLFVGVLYGALLAGVVIVVLLVLRRITLKTFIPFGPVPDHRRALGDLRDPLGAGRPTSGRPRCPRWYTARKPGTGRLGSAL